MKGIALHRYKPLIRFSYIIFTLKLPILLIALFIQGLSPAYLNAVSAFLLYPTSLVVVVHSCYKCLASILPIDNGARPA